MEEKRTEQNRTGEEDREEERRVMSQNNGVLIKSCTLLGKYTLPLENLFSFLFHRELCVHFFCGQGTNTTSALQYLVLNSTAYYPKT